MLAYFIDLGMHLGSTFFSFNIYFTIAFTSQHKRRRLALVSPEESAS